MQSRNPLHTDGKTITLDYSGMMSDVIGAERGISPEEMESLIPGINTAVDRIVKNRNSGEYGFFRLPYDSSAAGDVLDLAEYFRGSCDDFVVLGIGGSALGGKALFQALCSPVHNLMSAGDRGGLPRIHFLENIDPVTVKALLDYIDPGKTVFNVITKSGSTIETISQFLIAREILTETLGEKSARDHLVITTGEKSERLQSLTRENDYPLLVIPENVAGRFSVFSPVGLFPAAMAGIDISELLAGACYADERCGTSNFRENPAYMSGVLHYLADTAKGLNTAVMMPYSDALFQVAFWFRQLWAESLGKAESTSGKKINAGQTPVAALGVTDQHSQLQLYSGGPYNRMITFLAVDNHSEDIRIPPSPEAEYSAPGGISLSELMNIEYTATRSALTEAGRSNMSLIIPEITPFTVGQLLFMLEIQTVFAAGLYDVDPADQPGVEANKRHIRRMLDGDFPNTELNHSKSPDHAEYIL